VKNVVPSYAAGEASNRPITGKREKRSGQEKNRTKEGVRAWNETKPRPMVNLDNKEIWKEGGNKKCLNPPYG